MDDVIIPINVLHSIEKFLEFKFPKEYLSFISRKNGLIPNERLIFDFKDLGDGSVLSELFGFPINDTSILEWLKLYKHRIPNNSIPIGSDTFGNLILLSVKGPDYGKIYFWDHEMETEPADYSNLTLIADSFQEFIDNLKSEDELEDL